MTYLGKIAFGLAGGLALNGAVSAQVLAFTNNLAAGNPYGPIVARNVFGLLPPPDPNLQKEKDKEKDLPKINATGIQSFPGLPPQVLFKTSGGNPPGQPAKDKFYCLAEGQMEDEIEVTHIDTENAIVSFNNHGVDQDIPLVAPSNTGGGGPSGGGEAGGGGKAGNPFDRGGNPANGGGQGGIINIGGGRRPGMANAAAHNANYNAGGPVGANSAALFGQTQQGSTYQSQAPDPNITSDGQTLLIEDTRAKLLDSPHPEYPPGLLPPTPLTKAVTGEQ